MQTACNAVMSADLTSFDSRGVLDSINCSIPGTRNKNNLFICLQSNHMARSSASSPLFFGRAGVLSYPPPSP